MIGSSYFTHAGTVLQLALRCCCPASVKSACQRTLNGHPALPACTHALPDGSLFSVLPDLSHNKITNHGVRLLAKLLGARSVIMTLNLADNQIHADGGKYLGRALQRNESLLDLNLRLNRLDDEVRTHYPGRCHGRFVFLPLAKAVVVPCKGRRVFRWQRHCGRVVFSAWVIALCSNGDMVAYSQ